MKQHKHHNLTEKKRLVIVSLSLLLYINIRLYIKNFRHKLGSSRPPLDLTYASILWCKDVLQGYEDQKVGSFSFPPPHLQIFIFEVTLHFVR